MCGDGDWRALKRENKWVLVSKYDKILGESKWGFAEFPVSFSISSAAAYFALSLRELMLCGINRSIHKIMDLFLALNQTS